MLSFPVDKKVKAEIPIAHAINAYWGYGVSPVFPRLLVHENVIWSVLCLAAFLVEQYYSICTYY